MLLHPDDNVLLAVYFMSRSSSLQRLDMNVLDLCTVWVGEATDRSKSLLTTKVICVMPVMQIGRSAFLWTAPHTHQLFELASVNMSCSCLQHPSLLPFFSTNTVLKSSHNRHAHKCSKVHTWA